jgi:hypothetical protein
MGGRHTLDPTSSGRVAYTAIALVAAMLMAIAILAVTSVI